MKNFYFLWMYIDNQKMDLFLLFTSKMSFLINHNLNILRHSLKKQNYCRQINVYYYNLKIFQSKIFSSPTLLISQSWDIFRKLVLIKKKSHTLRNKKKNTTFLYFKNKIPCVRHPQNIKTHMNNINHAKFFNFIFSNF